MIVWLYQSVTMHPVGEALWLTPSASFCTQMPTGGFYSCLMCQEAVPWVQSFTIDIFGERGHAFVLIIKAVCLSHSTSYARKVEPKNFISLQWMERPTTWVKGWPTSEWPNEALSDPMQALISDVSKNLIKRSTFVVILRFVGVAVMPLDPSDSMGSKPIS